MTETLRRTFRQLRTRWGTPKLELVYSDGYQAPLPGGLHDAYRGEKILAWLAGQGLLRPRAVRHPHPASIHTLQRVHADAYLESLRGPEPFLRALGVAVDEATQDRVLAVQREMVGGTLLATRLALTTGRVTFNLGGGLHHAFADRAERFCFFNDIAAAIATERARGFRGRVLVVDLDLHDGDGVRSLFAEDETVHTCSIHNETNEQVGPVAAATVLELGSGIGDEIYLAKLRETLPPLMESFRPELVFYLAGADVAHDDRLGDWNLSADGILARDRFVVERVAALPGSPPLVILLAGGYGTDAWRYPARLAAWIVAGRELPPPPTGEEATLERYRRLAATFSRRELTSDDDDDTGWALSERDILGDLAATPQKRRFLGYYSLHGIELALEKGGALDHIRALGFSSPTFEMDLTNPSGDTLRLFGDAEKTELLMEIRVRRDRRTIPGMEALCVEWLLLQNPRLAFSPDRPRLPGQRYPGLGMLRDVVSFLILVCDRLHLDGVFFVPSHYHLAAQSRKLLRFLDPRDEGRFRALRAAVERLPLIEGSRAVDDGRLVDRDTGEPVAWQPAPMVLPVSDRLRERLLGEEYERQAQAAREGFCFVLAEA